MFHTVFVYGTLKTGQQNYYLMKENTCGVCIPKGRARTVEKFPLVVSSRYNHPCMLFEAGKGHCVEGELYEVDDNQLARLDQLENHPNLYKRREIAVVADESDGKSPDDLKRKRVFAYFLVKYQPHLLELPMFSSYEDGIAGEMLMYVEPSVHDASHVPYPLWWYEVHTEYQQNS